MRRRSEEGQVYPALLLAVLGSFAIAALFLPVQKILDQSNRADTAADSAALAAGKAQKDFTRTGILNAQLVMPALVVSLQGIISPMIQTEALRFARANGASLKGPVIPLGFDPTIPGWRFRVQTRQNDPVKGGRVTAHSESTATVVAKVDRGLCNGATGFSYGAMCVDATSWTACYSQYPPPYCFHDIGSTLRWKIYLTNGF